jgi:hypothetical protein
MKGGVMQYRITFTGDSGAIYSVTDDYKDDCHLSEGEWTKPFPNKKGESTAFRLVECLEQSGYNPFQDETIIKVKVEKLI